MVAISDAQRARDDALRETGFEHGYTGQTPLYRASSYVDGYRDGQAAWSRYTALRGAKHAAHTRHPECCTAPVPGGCPYPRRTDRVRRGRYCSAHERRVVRGSDITTPIKSKRVIEPPPEERFDLYDASRSEHIREPHGYQSPVRAWGG